MTVPSDDDGRAGEQRPLLNNVHDNASGETTCSPVPSTEVKMTWAARNQWVVLAVMSGACAAFNGVFAKLTTTDLTTNIAEAIANVLNIGAAEKVIEVIARCLFFGLNLVFNGIMWTVFTKALARGHSATQVSIMNTSTNFVITALMGFIIFSESLPPLWWAGAILLICGNVIIGAKDESLVKEGEAATGGATVAVAVASSASADASTNASTGNYEAVATKDIEVDEVVDKTADEHDDLVDLGDEAPS